MNNSFLVKLIIGISVFIFAVYLIQAAIGQFNGRAIVKQINDIKTGSIIDVEDKGLIPKHLSTTQNNEVVIKYFKLWPTQCRSIANQLKNFNINNFSTDCDHLINNNSISVNIKMKN